MVDFERILTGLSGLATGRTVAEQFGNMSNNVEQYKANAKNEAEKQRLLQEAQLAKQQGAAQQNRTLEWIRSQNPELAGAVEAGALSPGDAYKMHVEAKRPKTPEYMAVGEQLFDKTNGKFVNMPVGMQSENSEYGLNPVYGVDDAGNTTIMQLGKNGVATQVKLPPGFKRLTPGVTSLNTGDSYVQIDKRTGQPIAAPAIPINNAGKAEQVEMGQERAKAKAALPASLSMAQNINRQIEAIKNDPSLESVLGVIDSMLPSSRSEGTARVQAMIEQVKGGSFLAARQMLKGGGAITDFEGQKAEAAMVRMNQAQSPQDFKAALDEFNSAVQEGTRKLEALANGEGQQPQTQVDPNQGQPGAPNAPGAAVDAADYFN